MDYFQGVVTEFLRADRAMFVNTEYLIQLETGNAPAKGRHWYCDAVAINFRESTVYLCEVTYSKSMSSLLARLAAWASHWPLVCAALERDSSLKPGWTAQPWAFIPKDSDALFRQKHALLQSQPELASTMPAPRITFLESVAPWNYRSWDRKDNALANED